MAIHTEIIDAEGISDPNYIRRQYDELVNAYKAQYGLDLTKYIDYTAFESWVNAKGLSGAIQTVRESETAMFADAGLPVPNKTKDSPAMTALTGTTTGAGDTTTTGGTDTTASNKLFPWSGGTEGYWEDKPQATYLARLKAAGINPFTAGGQYQQGNSWNAYLPWLAQSTMGFAGGGQPDPFATANVGKMTPELMSQMMGLSKEMGTPGGEARQFLESPGMSNELTGMFGAASGAPYPLRKFMEGKADDYRAQWQSGGPDQVITFMDYLNKIFGNRF